MLRLYMTVLSLSLVWFKLTSLEALETYRIVLGCYHASIFATHINVTTTLSSISRLNCAKYCSLNSTDHTHSAIRDGSSNCYCSKTFDHKVVSSVNETIYCSKNCSFNSIDNTTSCTPADNYLVDTFFRASFIYPSLVSVDQQFELEIYLGTMSTVGYDFKLKFGDTSNTETLPTGATVLHYTYSYTKTGRFTAKITIDDKKIDQNLNFVTTVLDANYFGSSYIPYKIANTNEIYTVNSNMTEFVLMNAEIHFIGRLAFIEFYGAQEGQIEIDVYNSNYCGSTSTNITCGDLLDSIDFTTVNQVPLMIQHNYKTFNIKTGYNLFEYDFVVREGYFMRVKYLDATLGQLAINLSPYDINQTSTVHSDYSIAPYVSKINTTQGYANETINFFFRLGVDDIPPTLTFTCQNSTFVTGETFYFNLTTYSVNETNTILVNYTDGTYDSFNITGVNEFTSGINLTEYSYVNSRMTLPYGRYLIANTELVKDAYLAGFELYGAREGNITISIIKLDKTCGNGVVSCQIYLSSQSSFNMGAVKNTVYYVNDYHIAVGYNRISIEYPMFREQGFMVILNQTDGLVAIENSTQLQSTQRDYAIDSSDNGTLLSLNQLNATLGNLENVTFNSNSIVRFALSAIIRYPMYEGFYQYYKTFFNSSIYNVTATYDDYNATTVSQSILLTIYGQWTEWSSWSICTYTKRFYNSSLQLVTENGIVDCSYFLSDGEIQATKDARKKEQAISLANIQENLNNQLTKLDETMKAQDTAGSSAGSITIIFLCCFILFLVGLDSIQVLSYFNLVKPINYKRKQIKPLETYKLVRIELPPAPSIHFDIMRIIKPIRPRQPKPVQDFSHKNGWSSNPKITYDPEERARALARLDKLKASKSLAVPVPAQTKKSAAAAEVASQKKNEKAKNSSVSFMARFNPWNAMKNFSLKKTNTVKPNAEKSDCTHTPIELVEDVNINNTNQKDKPSTHSLKTRPATNEKDKTQANSMRPDQIKINESNKEKNSLKKTTQSKSPSGTSNSSLPLKINSHNPGARSSTASVSFSIQSTSSSLASSTVSLLHTSQENEKKVSFADSLLEASKKNSYLNKFKSSRKSLPIDP